ncbi:hypothetical protein [Streptomyces sp. NPDC048277]|uniref:hypothetical protein n=1 Tax=Streptomyces sp. NPDC048277 TaxID=3155027 RepID=UPI0033CF23E3
MQSLLVRDDDDRAKALADYVRGQEMEAPGKQMKKKARAMLDQTRAGVYGANELRWTGQNPVEEPDVQAMVDLYETSDLTVPMVPDKDRMVATLREAGLAVPLRKTGTKTARSIDVRPART